jgi:hypothetical protein
VYQAIDRFSEDVDVTIDYKALLPDADPFKEGISASQLSKLTQNLRDLVKKHTNEVVLPGFRTAERMDSDTTTSQRTSCRIADNAKKNSAQMPATAKKTSSRQTQKS